MNYVAIQAASSPEVMVLAFILMSNHVHFVLIGTEKDVRAFVDHFKQRYSAYYRHKYGANICSFSNNYPWGTGNLFFNPTKKTGIPLGSMSARERERILHSTVKHIPNHWIVGDEGFILPQNYVDVKMVERIYDTPKRMNYFLNTSSKARKRYEKCDKNLPAFKDQTILAALPDLCRSLFQKENFAQLSAEEQTEFLRQIRFRFSADILSFSSQTTRKNTPKLRVVCLFFDRLPALSIMPEAAGS